MSVSTVIIAIIAGALGYYAAVMWNRARPGDIDFDGPKDEHPDYRHGQTTVDLEETSWDSPDVGFVKNITKPKELLEIDLTNLKCSRTDVVSLSDVTEGPIFTISVPETVLHHNQAEIALYTELGDYVIPTWLLDKADIAIYGVFVKAIEEAYPEYVFADIGSFTGDFTREYGIVEKYINLLNELYFNLDDSGKEDRSAIQGFLASYAYARFGKIVEVTDALNKMLTDNELVEKFHILKNQGNNSIEFQSVKDEIESRVLDNEMIDKANSLINKLRFP